MGGWGEKYLQRFDVIQDYLSKLYFETHFKKSSRKDKNILEIFAVRT